jgi:hypothetical protein
MSMSLCTSLFLRKYDIQHPHPAGEKEMILLSGGIMYIAKLRMSLNCGINTSQQPGGLRE